MPMATTMIAVTQSCSFLVMLFFMGFYFFLDHHGEFCDLGCGEEQMFLELFGELCDVRGAAAFPEVGGEGVEFCGELFVFCGKFFGCCCWDVDGLLYESFTLDFVFYGLY